VVFPLEREIDGVDLFAEVFESKEASRCMIIELENIHARVLCLHEVNWKGN